VGRLIEITLGIMTAVGGFVDISELVFAAQSGSRFGFALIWAFAFATIGIIVFGEMSGRVAPSPSSRFSISCASDWASTLAC